MTVALFDLTALTFHALLIGRQEIVLV